MLVLQTILDERESRIYNKGKIITSFIFLTKENA